MSSSAPAREAQRDAADTLQAASSALHPSKTSIGQKIAMASTLYRLARRYPGPAIIVGALALVYFLSTRRHAHPARTWH